MIDCNAKECLQIQTHLHNLWNSKYYFKLTQSTIRQANITHIFKKIITVSISVVLELNVELPFRQEIFDFPAVNENFPTIKQLGLCTCPETLFSNIQQDILNYLEKNIDTTFISDKHEVTTTVIFARFNTNSINGIYEKHNKHQFSEDFVDSLTTRTLAITNNVLTAYQQENPANIFTSAVPYITQAYIKKSAVFHVKVSPKVNNTSIINLVANVQEKPLTNKQNQQVADTAYYLSKVALEHTPVLAPHLRISPWYRRALYHIRMMHWEEAVAAIEICVEQLVSTSLGILLAEDGWNRKGIEDKTSVVLGRQIKQLRSHLKIKSDVDWAWDNDLKGPVSNVKVKVYDLRNQAVHNAHYITEEETLGSYTAMQEFIGLLEKALVASIKKHPRAVVAIVSSNKYESIELSEDVRKKLEKEKVSVLNPWHTWEERNDKRPLVTPTSARPCVL